jgi:hypothetical protein
MITLFDGNNYALWSDRVKTLLLAIGVDVWISIENGYNPQKFLQLILMRRKHASAIIKQGTIS